MYYHDRAILFVLTSPLTIVISVCFIKKKRNFSLLRSGAGNRTRTISRRRVVARFRGFLRVYLRRNRPVMMPINALRPHDNQDNNDNNDGDDNGQKIPGWRTERFSAAKNIIISAHWPAHIFRPAVWSGRNRAAGVHATNSGFYLIFSLFGIARVFFFFGRCPAIDIRAPTYVYIYMYT